MRRVGILFVLVAGCGGAVDAPPTAEGQEAFAGFNYCYDYTHCSTDANCPTGQSCVGGDCRWKVSSHLRCEDYLGTEVSRNAAGDRDNCFPSKCDWGTGQCKRSCWTGDDCAAGYACNRDTLRCEYNDTNPPGYVSPAYPGLVPNVAPDVERSNLCSNACGSRAAKSYEVCYEGRWVPGGQWLCTPDRQGLQWGDYFSYSVIPDLCWASISDRVHECSIDSQCQWNHHCTSGYCDPNPIDSRYP
jgi:hypothetical protein